MGFKNFYVTLNESEEDYAHQTELGKKLGLEHKGKGVYENKGGDKYFYNKNSGTFKGWKGSLDPNNPEHHVKPTENLEAKKEMLEKDIEEKSSHDVDSLKKRNSENVKVINKHLSDGGKIDLHYEKSNGEHVYPKSLTKNDAGKIKVDNETGHIVDEKGKSLEDHEMTYKVHDGLHSGHVLGHVNNTHKIKEKEGVYSNPNVNLIKSEKDYVESYNDKTKIHGKVTFKNNLDHWDTDKKEADLSKNKDGSDFEEFDETRFKKPEKVHERFQVHGHEFVVHTSKRTGGNGSGYDKHSISHESGLPITPGSTQKKSLEMNVNKTKNFLSDFRDSQDLGQYLKKQYSDIAIQGKFYPDVKDFKNQFDYGDHNKFVSPLREKFEKHFGEDVKKSHEKRNNIKQNGFIETVGERTYVDHSHFTPHGGMEGGRVVDRHNKTGRQVLFDDKEEKYYLGDKVVAPYDGDAFQKNPKYQVRYKTLGGETKYTHGGHTEPYDHPKNPEDKHFSEVKKQQIEMAHNVIRGAYEKMDDDEKKRAIEKLGSGKFHEENMTSEHGKRFNKAAGYLGELSRSGLKKIYKELSQEK